jgi:nicotinamide mononucleotide (NMN) deamidase PncC
MSIPNFEDLLPNELDSEIIKNIKYNATLKGYELLKLINSKAVWANKKDNPDDLDRYLQIATSESLTCGLIMATLVDIPWGGFMKYGGFGVYDTDAKRVFNNVKVDDVYTHKCAAEMAIGVLKNSNATIAIAVTGNAMPLNEHVDMLGEVFISIAGYDMNNNIIFITKSINACIDTDIDNMQNICKKWYDTIKFRNRFNSRNDTASLSQEIRYYTVMKAYELCIEFIQRFEPCVPLDILKSKLRNDVKDVNNMHINIPINKYEFGGKGICLNSEIGGECIITGNREEEDINTFNMVNNQKINIRIGGISRHRKSKYKKSIK